ncbi:hypothetical protein [Mycobacterium tuberculosis]|uniref:hypothetical protein n=1 Tax=Mycobacterium tuberculosis TaxID=1773 RepID=UPI0011153543|nr:hypothetical protein [Mycobacterium tuberculosis]
MEGGSPRRTAKKKTIGDVTSVTIPHQYIDFITKESKPVTPELLAILNTALSQRELVHLIFTGIAAVNSLGDFKHSVDELQRILGWQRTLFTDLHKNREGC